MKTATKNTAATVTTELTDSQKADRKRDHIIMMLKADVADCDEQLAKFVEGIQKDAHYALQWSADAFISASKKRAALVVLDFFERIPAGKYTTAEGLAEVEKYIRAQALRSAYYPARSTSPQSNLIAQEDGSAYARMLERFEGGR